MQRRAAAVYFVLFVLVGAGAYAFLQIGMAEPTVELSGPSYAQGDELTVDGRTYTVANVEVRSGEGGGGHGSGGGEETLAGNLTWFNESARTSATVDNGSTIAFRDGEYTVVAGNESFELVEAHNVTAILAADPNVEDQPAEQGDEQYVFYTNGTRQLLSAYLPEPDRAGPFAAGDAIEYRPENETVTARIDGVTPESVALSWSAPEEETVDLDDGANVTLAGVEHLVHFPSDSRVQVLPTEQYYESYAADQARIDGFHERKAGFWGVTILSFLAAIVLLSTAYMPVRS